VTGKTQMAVSVAISTRDRPELLARCLESLLAGETRPAEIVVVDQSRDGRTEAAAHAMGTADVEIVYVRHDGSGLGASQNMAVDRARHEVVAVTDDDCVVHPRWLSVAAAAFDGERPVDLLTGRVLPLGPEAPGRHPVSSRTSTLRREFGPDAAPWDVGSGNNFAVRRTLFLAIGGNDERLGPGSPGQGGVDMDLFYRLLRAGARARFEPDAVVFHEQVTRSARMSRRRPYGYGMGACCSLRYAEGDRRALRLLARWIRFRLRRLAGAVRHGDRLLAHEEALVLAGTFAGLRYGYRCRRTAGALVTIAR
jgi:glycosyltransferase involved in cell wall biosynthesis